nr:hypothetical protein [Tanacetum cinerariifolium]
MRALDLTVYDLGRDGGVVRRCGGDEVVATATGDGWGDDDVAAVVAAEEVVTRWL